MTPPPPAPPLQVAAGKAAVGREAPMTMRCGQGFHDLRMRLAMKPPILASVLLGAHGSRRPAEDLAHDLGDRPVPWPAHGT